MTMLCFTLKGVLAYCWLQMKQRLLIFFWVNLNQRAAKRCNSGNSHTRPVKCWCKESNHEKAHTFNLIFTFWTRFLCCLGIIRRDWYHSEDRARLKFSQPGPAFKNVPTKTSKQMIAPLNSRDSQHGINSLVSWIFLSVFHSCGDLYFLMKFILVFETLH